MSAAPKYDTTDLAGSLKRVLPDPRNEFVLPIKKGTGEIAGPCPFCGEGHDRFHLRVDGLFSCRQCGAKGGDRIDYFKQIHNTDFMGLVDMYLNGNQAKQQRREKLPKARVTAKNLTKVYPYQDETGVELYQVFRFEEYGREKTFRQGVNGDWKVGINGIRRVLYNLPKLTEAGKILLVEGEKDADRLYKDGFIATTSPMGAPNWKDEYSEFLKDKDVVIFRDNDEAGDVFVKKTTASLIGKAKSVKVISLPGLPAHGDVSDWLNNVGDAEKLIDIIDKTPEYAPISTDDAGQTNTSGWQEPTTFDTSEAPPVPVDVLPEPARSFADAGSEAIQVPVELMIMGVIGAVSAAAQGKYKVRIKEDYSEPLNTYSVTYLPPAERKSAALVKCKKPLIDWEIGESKRLQPEIDAKVSERKTRLKAIETLRAKAGKAQSSADLENTIEQVHQLETDLPEVPCPPRFFIDDITPEGLALFMSSHDNRAAILEAEGGIFELMAGLYTKGASNLNIWLKSWSSESINVDRKTTESIRVVNPALTICLIVQPEVLRSIGEKPGFRGLGLLGRFLYCFPKSRLGQRRVETKPVQADISLRYKSMLVGIAQTEWAVNDKGDNTHQYLCLSKGAYQEWRKFAEQIEAELGNDGIFSGMTDWAGKIPGQAARIAGLFHIIENEEPTVSPISLETMSMALKFAAIMTEHAQVAFGQMSAEPTVACAGKILKWIADNNITQFSTREAHRAVRGTFKTMKEIEPGLDELEGRGYVRLLSLPKKAGPGRRPGKKYNVNPYVNKG